jgi:hypothetical protein
MWKIFLVLLTDFLITSLIFGVLCVVVSACGFALTFSWGLAFAFWIITKLLKIIF